MTEFEGIKVVIIFIFFEVFFEVDNGGNVLLTIYCYYTWKNVSSKVRGRRYFD